MASLDQLLTDSLQELHDIQQKTPYLILHGTEQLSRVHLKRLLDNGWIQEVMKGWYIPSQPGCEGDTTVWYTSYWHFVKAYLESRYGDQWVLMPDASLDLLSGKTTVPIQLTVKATEASNNIVSLPYGHSLLSLKSELPKETGKDGLCGINVYPLGDALIYASPLYFQREEISARTCLSMIKDVNDVLRTLLDTGATTRAGRLAGAFRNNGQIEFADTIMTTMRDFGYKLTENDPFQNTPTIPFRLETSPYVSRIRQMWAKMRQQVIDNFPLIDIATKDTKVYLEHVDEKYLEDAYHSLSIEGYQVSKELIDKVRSGSWHPDEDDRDHKRALVARGYFQAFNAVKLSLEKILEGRNAGEVASEDHPGWYRQMWMPFVTAGILQPSDLLGYRRGQVYIRGSKHTPLNPDAVIDAMGLLFELLREEPDARVRAVLGHFIFVFIHPYMDGNGRMGRFMLNTMLASGGYPWTIVPVERRTEYMKALEKASVEEDVSDFTRLIAELVSKEMNG